MKIFPIYKDQKDIFAKKKKKKMIDDDDYMREKI